MDMFERTRRLIGAEALEKLKNARVIVLVWVAWAAAPRRRFCARASGI